MNKKQKEAIAWYMVAVGRFYKTEIDDMIDSGYFQQSRGIEITEEDKAQIYQIVVKITDTLAVKGAKKLARAFPKQNA